MKKFILAIFGIIFTSFIFSSNSFALSDVTLTFDDSHRDGFICRANQQDVPNCYDYKYIYIQVNGGTFDSNTLTYYFTLSPNGNSRSYNIANTLIDISSYYNNSQFDRIYFDSASVLYSTLGITSFTITLSEDNPLGSSCPEPEPAPPCPDPEENSQYINVVLDSFWKYHKAFAGAVVAIIVIFLVYRLIKGVMR